ncbi:MAG: hypothetical protein Q4P34_06470 [Tissierellia bacterium]|nr:hypothetical protein [Tissierellia bacterium]
MKKILLIAIILFLVGCGNSEKYIDEAKLNKDQKEILKLTNIGDGNYRIYDFKVDDKAKKFKLNLYKRDKNEWVKYSGLHDVNFKETNGGRFLVYLSKGEFNFVFLDEDQGTVCLSSPLEINEEEGIAYISSYLSHRYDIKYNEEIPIGIYIFEDSNKSIESVDVDEFFKTDRIDQNNYREVYAVTIKFED